MVRKSKAKIMLSAYNNLKEFNALKTVISCKQK